MRAELKHGWLPVDPTSLHNVFKEMPGFSIAIQDNILLNSETISKVISTHYVVSLV